MARPLIRWHSCSATHRAARSLGLVGTETGAATAANQSEVVSISPESMGRLAIIKELRKLGVDYSHVKGDINGLRTLIAQHL